MATRDRSEFSKLVGKYLDGTASAEERAVLDAYYEIFAGAPDALSGLNEDGLKALEVKLKAGIDKKAGVAKGTGVAERAKVAERPVVPLYRKWKYASIAAVLALVVGLWFFNSKYGKFQDGSGTGNSFANDVAPGRNGATLTLASGEVIELSDVKNGVVVGKDLTYNDGSAVSRNGNPLSPQGGSLPEGERRGGNLSPSGRDAEGREGSKILTASTAKGQTYQVTLPDGTKVWLNADSKLTFPSDFGKARQRIVELSGEGYFAVVHNAKQPFLVQSKTADGKLQIVEDIGTEFNINAYGDEASVKTTLLEGSARVSQLKGSQFEGSASVSQLKETPSSQPTTHNSQLKENSQLLLPGQQAINNGTDRIGVKAIDIQEAIDWKNGKFVFEQENIKSIMRKISRWYNVEVVYEGDVEGKALGGSVSRFGNVSEVLERLAATKAVRFRVEGRIVTVLSSK